MTFARFWKPGSSEHTLLLSTSDVSNYVMQDWLPSLPQAISKSVVGWPFHILESTTVGGTEFLGTSPILAGVEKQWRGVFSWQMGVAGTRAALQAEGFHWIAPVSAFYTSAAPIQTGVWPGWLSAGQLTAMDDPTKAGVRLRPDYIAVKFVFDASGELKAEFAVAESKGTKRSLVNLTTCPRNWSQQARKSLFLYANTPLPLSRHIVVATRTSPQAVRSATRRLQVRWWNNNSDDSVDPGAGLEVVGASLAILCDNLGLSGCVRMLNQVLGEATHRAQSEDHNNVFVQARSEIEEVRHNQSSRRVIEFPDISVAVDLGEPVLAILEQFLTGESRDNILRFVAERDADIRQRRDIKSSGEGSIVGPGVSLLPRRRQI